MRAQERGFGNLSEAVPEALRGDRPRGLWLVNCLTGSSFGDGRDFKIARRAGA
jgi:hypothetical protein